MMSCAHGLLTTGLLAGACAALGACANSSGNDHARASSTDPGVFTYLLDRNGKWQEDKVDTLPPPPHARDLLSFDVSPAATLDYALDASSLSVGADGVVRYTVVIRSPTGAHNVFYEGIGCDTYEVRRYAALKDDGEGWDRTIESGWRRIESSELNGYHGVLYADYLYANRLPAGSAKEIVQNIRYRRPAVVRYQ